jgi:hypothetical protein
MGYYTDFKSISIDSYKDILKESDLLPGRKILKDNIENNFKVIKKFKIPDLEELLNRLKDRKKLQDFSKLSGLPENYLTILAREIRSIQPKPNKIEDFPGVTRDIVSKLERIGVKNTFQLFDKVLRAKDRIELSRQTGIDEKDVLRITKLADLSRIRWVNHTFAYVLLEAAYDTVKKVANADYKELYEKVKRLNEERKIYKGNIGLHDMKLCVDSAKNVPPDIKY